MISARNLRAWSSIRLVFFPPEDPGSVRLSSLFFTVSILSVTHLLSNHHYLSWGGGGEKRPFFQGAEKLIRQSEVSKGNRGLGSSLTLSSPLGAVLLSWGSSYPTGGHLTAPRDSLGGYYWRGCCWYPVGRDQDCCRMFL